MLLSKKQICIGIVTYNPNIEELEKTIKNSVNQVDSIIIVDNCSKNIERISLITKQYKLHLIENDKNKGIATALNQIFESALSTGYKWVLTLDDDSIIPTNMIESYIDASKGIQNIGIICPLLQSKSKGYIFHSKTADNECITSGSLTSVEAWKAVGGFDDWLFIDCVDFDFVYRLHKAGYIIVEDKNVILPHEIGNGKTINLIIAHPAVYGHSPFRKYYQERNLIYIDYKFGKYLWFIDFARFIKHVFLVLIWEDNKLNKLKAMTKGRIDGLKKIDTMRKRGY